MFTALVSLAYSIAAMPVEYRIYNSFHDSDVGRPVCYSSIKRARVFADAR